MERISTNSEAGGAGGSNSYSGLKRLDQLWSNICNTSPGNILILYSFSRLYYLLRSCYFQFIIVLLSLPPLSLPPCSHFSLPVHFTHPSFSQQKRYFSGCYFLFSLVALLLLTAEVLASIKEKKKKKKNLQQVLGFTNMHKNVDNYSDCRLRY